MSLANISKDMKYKVDTLECDDPLLRTPLPALGLFAVLNKIKIVKKQFSENFVFMYQFKKYCNTKSYPNNNQPN